MASAQDANREPSTFCDRPGRRSTGSPQSETAERQSNYGYEATTGTRDFQRVAVDCASYDRIPSGPPPRISTFAVQNDSGNSNGLLPFSPITTSRPGGKFAFFRRALGTVLPTFYAPLPSEDLTNGSESRRTRGGGTENDGVFANLTAKPQASRTILGRNGEVHVLPENSLRETPPSYDEVQADAVPTYQLDAVVVSDSPLPDGFDISNSEDVLIDGLSTGAIFVFAANAFTSFFFELVGFGLTYLLHSSHAAKQGSIMGLGLMLLQHGFSSLIKTGVQVSEGVKAGTENTAFGKIEPYSLLSLLASQAWIAFLFTTIGWFLVFVSVFSFWRVKCYERTVRATFVPSPTQPRRFLQNFSTVAPSFAAPSPSPLAAEVALCSLSRSSPSGRHDPSPITLLPNAPGNNAE